MHLNRVTFFLIFNFYLSFFLYSRSATNSDSLPQIKTGWRYNSRILSIGVGTQNTDIERFADLKAARDYTISSIKASNPLYLKLEFHVSKRFGIGAALNYNNMRYDYSYNASNGNQPVLVKKTIDYEVYTTNIRVNYHFLYGKKIDFYLGAGAGLRIVGNKSKTNMKELSSGFVKETELTAGLRYLAEGVFGLYLEAGLTRSIVQAGLSFNLNKLR
ncbi:hypothetical protein CNR22_15810 [Sphingobacteriaceae bacterium]|nr:hypothetical protein CNR22_15810 [Sphingobacteriaceae bacterium]